VLLLVIDLREWRLLQPLERDPYGLAEQTVFVHRRREVESSWLRVESGEPPAGELAQAKKVRVDG
jgi:hypothetical protein